MVEEHTFLFCDLVGFTALTAAEGDMRGAEVCIEFGERVRPMLRQHRAEQIKAIGDALMIRGDEAALGIRLGIRVVRDLEQVGGFPPVRVGVHTGPAVTRNDDWYGNTVNVAARLCSAAGGGQVLASETALEAAGRLKDLDLGDRRLHWLKNVTEPVAARTVAVRERVGRLGRGLGSIERLFIPTAGSPA
ncbi:MAG: adenylate cyclase [Thermoleophilaceae bacterium]|jgi:adenylate cyclase|nr:adenylate cyclase [Thermoleophilaceae bacterium]